jgi:hypothetical protein
MDSVFYFARYLGGELWHRYHICYHPCTLFPTPEHNRTTPPGVNVV